MEDRLSRREFLKRSALIGAAVAGYRYLEVPAAAEAATGKSRVVVVRDQALLAGDGVDQKVAERMLGQAMAKLVGANSGAQAWKMLFKPTDVVGLKVNCLCGKGVSTHPEITYAVVSGLKMAGVPEGNIIIWDRSSGDLAKSGYTLNKGEGVRVLADDGDWGEAVRSGSISGRLSKIITEKITALVNVPILKTHGIPGLTCALKNHYGSFDNPGAAHGDGCNPYLADLNALPQIKNKTRLIVVDAARPQCDGGPSLRADAQFDYHGIIISKDPLAADRVGLEIINERRKQTGRQERTVESLKWFASSAKAGVGVCDLSKIELVNI